MSGYQQENILHFSSELYSASANLKVTATFLNRSITEKTTDLSQATDKLLSHNVVF
jgi:hypothetical protein